MKLKPEELSPVQIYEALDTGFGEANWVGWDPETVLAHLEDLSDLAKDKVLAVHAFAHNTKLASTEAVAFENICHAFCNNHIVPTAHQAPEVVELSYTVREMRALAKLVHGKEFELNFTGEIPNYVAGTAKFRGWFFLPQDLVFGQSLLSHLTGLNVGMPRYEEHAKLLNAADKVMEALGPNPKLEDVLAHLEHEDALTDFTRGLVSCAIYDPTK